MARFSSRTTAVRFEDAASFGLAVGPGPGDFQHSDTNSENAERLRVMDRNRFDGHVLGDDLEQTWSITVELRNEVLTHATLARITDFIQRTGSFASPATQSLSTNPDVWAFRVKVTMTLGAVTTTYTLPHNVASYAKAEAKEGNRITISGTNNGAITRA